jgi:hypothetical protein
MECQQNMLAQLNIDFPFSFRLLVLDLIRGFPWDWLVLESLEQLNFVVVSFSFSPMFAGASI